MARLVLASSSPRRAALLDDMGLAHTAIAPEVDEMLDPGALEQSLVRVATAKANDVSTRLAGIVHVLAADTVGLHRGDVLGKPRTEEEAVALLERLSGTRHDVLSAVCAVRSEDGRTVSQATGLARTAVHFHPLPRATIEAYVATGEPMDKAAGYAIQGRAAPFVRHIEGSYHNVVGLPLDLALAALARTGLQLPQHLRVPTYRFETGEAAH